jgi:hypothetical protein
MLKLNEGANLTPMKTSPSAIYLNTRLPSWTKGSNRPNTKNGGMEDRCSEIHLTLGVAGNPDPPVRRSLRAQRLHNIDARSASRW